MAHHSRTARTKGAERRKVGAQCLPSAIGRAARPPPLEGVRIVIRSRLPRKQKGIILGGEGVPHTPYPGQAVLTTHYRTGAKRKNKGWSPIGTRPVVIRLLATLSCTPELLRTSSRLAARF
jgi:hypothetical protein